MLKLMVNTNSIQSSNSIIWQSISRKDNNTTTVKGI